MVAPDLDLPSSETVRWSLHRKASVVNDDRRGAIRTGKPVGNLDTRGVSVDDRQVRLTNKEYSIIELLSLRKGTILTKEMMLSHLYGGVDEPELKIIDVFVCKAASKTRPRDWRETLYRDRVGPRICAARPDARAGGGALSGPRRSLGARHEDVGIRTAEERTVR